LKEGEVSKVIELPSRMSGLVVGKHGLVLKGIEQRTRTRIQLRDSNIGSEMAKVSIDGAPADVELAALEIQDILESSTAPSAPRRRADQRQDSRPDRASQSSSYASRDATAKLPLFSPGYREKIWEAYKTDPERNTPEELCRQFRVTSDHLQAIFLVMKHREDFVQRYKEDEQMMSPSLEQAMIKKCGEDVPRREEVTRPICKTHYRFVSEDSELAKVENESKYLSISEELELKRQAYEEKAKDRPVKPKPKSLQPIVAVKQTDKFRVVFQQ
jgi:hypothetical protein